MWGVGDRSSAPSAEHERPFSEHAPKFFSRFSSKTEFLSYLFLFLVKMPFPPVNRPRTISGPSKEKQACPSPLLTVKGTEERGSVKEKLKLLGKKATPHKSRLPTSLGLRPDGKSSWITTPRPIDLIDGSTASSGNDVEATNSLTTSSLAATGPDNSASATTSSSNNTKSPSSTESRGIVASLGHSRSHEKNETKEVGAVRFALSLTPEAVLLLQRRNREKQLRTAKNSTDTGLRRRNPSLKNPRMGPQGSSHAHAPMGRLGSGPQDASVLMKVSLLNERHRYDDVEYEDEDRGVDESVLLKCAEWLRGVENAPLTAGSYQSMSHVST
ncbi:proline-rich protein 18 [Chanos chanos]|uniref:Proline-rich protein 18 n=1 Tax=Chanos chanos TaxID=29144 RepID=A0A6J2VPM5_CHACN|nr:proline-rich protein 18-like [Chanos chanos]